MPGGDGTGPMRQGPMTGGGFGLCGSGGRRQWSGGRVRCHGGGFGAGYGWRHHRWSPWSHGWRWASELDGVEPPWSPEDERDELQRAVLNLERDLQRLRARLAEIDSETAG